MNQLDPIEEFYDMYLEENKPQIIEVAIDLRIGLCVKTETEALNLEDNVMNYPFTPRLSHYYFSFLFYYQHGKVCHTM